MDDPDALELAGWSQRWAALLAEHGDHVEPGRVVRHDGVAVTVLTRLGERVVPLRRGLEPVVVGDWLALDGDHISAVLERASLLRRRAAGSEDAAQLLAANVDLVLIVCGVDRPLRAGRIERGEALARDAGAEPLLVLTKVDLAADVAAVVGQLAAAHPALDLHATSAVTDEGVPELRARIGSGTTVLLGESGAGKSQLVNALAGHDVARTGAVRAGDAKGRHTTTHRQLHLLPGGGAVVDSPGIREVGVLASTDAVDEAFADIDELAARCRFGDCAHESEPACAVRAAVEAGTVTAERYERYLRLRAETEAAERRADEHARRRHERRGARTYRQAKRDKYG